jgi:enamine deaminase RidA (YjgF/YER057c/UK114 family)
MPVGFRRKRRLHCVSGPKPAGAYSVARSIGDLVHTAGMTPRRDGVLLASGLFGREIGNVQGRELTALATVRALEAAQSILNPKEALTSVVSLTVYLATTPDFTLHGHIADAASAVVREWIPEAELPVRAAVGVASLPGGAPVEVQLIAQRGAAQ